MSLKKSLPYVLALFVAIGFTSCGGDQSGDSSDGEEMSEEEKDGDDHSEGDDHDHSGEGGSEHPDDEGNEHPDDEGSEHPDESSKSSSLTIEQFADAAKAHIEKEQNENNGFFRVEDEEQGKTLKLQLEKVHRKRLSNLGGDKYFVCADFKAQDGKTYDVDIFMKGTKKSNLEEVRDPKVHKVAGEPRFTYKKEDGVWKQKPVKQQASS